MMKRALKFYLLNLGCPKNEVDGQSLEYHLRNAGCLPSEPEKAGILIVNSCGFIDDAKRESIDEILRLAECKHDSAILAVTGCLSQRYREELKEEIPEVDYLFGISSPAEIAEVLLTGNAENIDCTFEIEGGYQVGEGRYIDPKSHYAYMKIADGCDNHCSYCAIPSIRGQYRSRPLDDIEKEADFLLSKGVRELILVAQETTRYGQEFEDKSLNLEFLIRELISDKRLGWLRLLYAHPARVTDSLLETIANNKQVCSYLDLPLQHISDKMLRKMNRGVTSADIKLLVSRIKNNFPDIALRTTFIVGYPGETDEDFEQLAEFVDQVQFDSLGCFLYSEEEGTASAKATGKVDREIAQERLEQLMLIQSTIVEDRNRQLVGKVKPVIVDSYESEYNAYLCRLERQSPEIDGYVVLQSGDRNPKVGSIVNVRITDFDMYDLKAKIEDNSGLRKVG
ncbi:MAG: 30S ribosomal protein S12 methylthiotransferase RimO [candidate division Zixibacteria bacterium]|nr:30S ribosomal protein S12 methylthiotransferase RimO [candidate division Zixibacteria bacterium]